MSSEAGTLGFLGRTSVPRSPTFPGGGVYFIIYVIYLDASHGFDILRVFILLLAIAILYKWFLFLIL